jgi:hypothetical protein
MTTEGQNFPWYNAHQFNIMLLQLKISCIKVGKAIGADWSLGGLTCCHAAQVAEIKK